MELKWLEDFVSVAEKGHFARAAEDRLVTQSALSRRIKSLEIWLGTELFDRSQHPIALTKAGQEFISFAHEFIRKSYDAQANAIEFSKVDDSTLRIACLHTLKLLYVPRLVRQIQKNIGDFSTVIVTEKKTVEEYLTGLQNGISDIFVCYAHPAIPFDIDRSEFPYIEIDHHEVYPYQHNSLPIPDMKREIGEDIPYIKYSSHTYMTRVVDHILQKAKFRNRLKTTYQASLAESVASAAQQKFGIAWIPETVIPNSPENIDLTKIKGPWHTTLTIRLYRSAKNTSPILEKVWGHFNSA